jgi:hypothetical protein
MVSFDKKINHTSPYGANVIHRVVLAGFAVEPPKTEQSDAQNSVFRNSAGL